MSQEDKKITEQAEDGAELNILPNNSEKKPGFADIAKLLENNRADIKRILVQLGGDKAAMLDMGRFLREAIEKAEAEGGELDNLRRCEQQLLEILGEQKERIDQEVIDRAERDISFAGEVEKMFAGQEFNSGNVADVLERRMWGKFFSNLKKGDRVVSFLVPGADFLSIKNLNDKIFGPQITNQIIEKKRLVLEEKIKKIDQSASFLQSDYKTEVVKISSDSSVGEKDLGQVMAEVDKDMQQFVAELAGRLLDSEQDKHRIETLKDFLGKLNGDNGKGGFKMNYGLATVEGDEAKDQLLALDHSLQTSRMARESNDRYGFEHNESNTLQEVDRIKDLRNSIIESGNSIKDEDGNEFNIFSKSEEEGKYIFNRDLLRDVRKNKFKTADKGLMEKISLYVKKLNILDAVKVFTYNEIEQVKEEANVSRQLSEKIKKGDLSDEDRKNIAEILNSDEKAKEFTSKSEFHKRAVAMEDAAYVSMDVLDLGIDLLLEYENALQDVENAPDDKKLDKFNDASLNAGDKTTEKLRDFRSQVVKVYKEFGLGDGLIVGEIGGDELTLAIDMNVLGDEQDKAKKEEKLNQLLFALKKATNTRVIKTVVAESEKHITDESDSANKVEAHLRAMKRAETGAAIAKDIEEAARKLTLLLKKQGETKVRETMANLPGLFSIENGKVKSSIVITEKNGSFKIDNENEGDEETLLDYEFDYEEIHNELDKILDRKKTS